MQKNAGRYKQDTGFRDEPCTDLSHSHICRHTQNNLLESVNFTRMWLLVCETTTTEQQLHLKVSGYIVLKSCTKQSVATPFWSCESFWTQLTLCVRYWLSHKKYIFFCFWRDFHLFQETSKRNKTCRVIIGYNLMSYMYLRKLNNSIFGLKILKAW